MHTRRHFISAIIAALGGSVFAADGKPKIIVLQSAWDTVNIGDIGHTPGTLRVIEEHLPEVKVVLWAMKLDERVTTMLKARFPKVEILQGKLDGKGEKDLRLQEAIKGCDLFIRNSGMGQDLSYMKFCRQHGKPYVLFGQSFFPTMVQGSGAEERIALLNAASFIYTRETKTLAILQGAGVKAEFGPDGCFGIDVRDDVRGLATMKKLGLEEKKFITVQIRTNTPKAPGVDDPRPEKLNPLHPTPQQVADDERRAAKFRELVTQWVKKTGGKVLISPETIKEMGHNKRLIHDPLPPEIQKHVVNLEYFWNADEGGFDLRTSAHHRLPRAAFTHHRTRERHPDHPHLLRVPFAEVLDVQGHRFARVAPRNGRNIRRKDGGDALCHRRRLSCCPGEGEEGDGLRA
jgi:hypothetical protein